MSPILDDDKVYVQYDNLIQNTFFQVTVNGIKELISFIKSPLCQSKHAGDHYIIQRD